MESAIYGALDALDAYRETCLEIITEQEASGDPNQMLVKRLRQLAGKADIMTKTIEDDVLAELMFCLDRLFSVKTAEEGTFI
jgi:hypothetical protein